MQAPIKKAPMFYFFDTDCERFVIANHAFLRDVAISFFKNECYYVKQISQPKNKIIILKTYFYEKFTKFWRSRVEC